MALKIRPDQFPGLETNVRTKELARTSRMVARLTGYQVQWNKAVVGKNAFAHESGIHQQGVLKDRSTYEIIEAASVGQEGGQIVLGKHTGRHAFVDALAKLGIMIQGDGLNLAFARFKELADRKVQLTDADLEAIVAEEIGQPLRRDSSSTCSTSRAARSECRVPGSWSVETVASPRRPPKATA